MKKKLFIVAFIAATIVSNSQEFKTETFGATTKKEGEPKEFIGKIGSNFYALIDGDNLKSDILHRYDENLKLVSSYKVGDNSKSFFLQGEFIIFNELYVLTIETGKKKDSYFLTKYNKETLEPTSEKTEVYSEAGIKMNEIGLIYGPRFQVTYSTDSTLFSMGFFREDSAYISVYEKGMKLKWKKSFKPTNFSSKAGILGFKITNEGNGALLYGIHKEGIGAQKDQYSYNLFAFNNNGVTTNYTEFNDDKKMVGLNLHLDRNNKIYLYGYNDFANSYMPEEIIFEEIDLATGKLTNKKALKFTNPIFPEKLSYSEKLKAKKEDFREVKDKNKYGNRIYVYQTNMDEYYFILQQHYFIRDPEGMHTYAFDNIFVHYYNKSTSKEWEVLFPMGTMYSIKEYGGFLPMMFNNKFHLIFNDCSQNAEKTGNQDIVESKIKPTDCTHTTFIASFDNNGFLKRETLDNAKYALFYLKPSYNYLNKELFIGYSLNKETERNKREIGIMKITSK